MQNQMIGSFFGRVIAFVIPGLIALYALSYFAPPLRNLFGLTQPPTVAGFLFVLLCSIGLGVFVSGIRWMIFHLWLEREIDATNLNEKNDDAFRGLVSDYYQFYQFYSNSAVSVLFFFAAWVLTQPYSGRATLCFGIATLATLAVLITCARNTAGNYYRESNRFLRKDDS